MAETPIRTRFAPSPTGFLHVGSARTALFNWAYARRHRGELVLRIEDTDRERSTEESERTIVEGLAWLGMDWDVGPYRQSERADRHREVVDELLAKGAAYRCVCTRDELEVRKQATIAAGGKWTYDGRCRELALGADCGEHTVRLRLPASGPLDWDDGVFGPSGQDASEIGDRIICRADGSPLYSLSVVVDDLDDGVTDVIRGADHHPNTPFHVALYEAIGAPLPRFAHVPLILNDQGKKLSKRRDPVAVEQFREQGYLPEAMRNWIVRLGWSHGDQEVFSGEEITALFDLEHVGRSAARADRDKLDWLNQHYIMNAPAEALHEALAPFLAKSVGAPVPPSEGLSGLVDLNRQRSKTLVDLAERSRWLAVEPVVYDEKAANKQLTPASGELLASLRERLAGVEDWSDATLEAAFEAEVAAHEGLKMGKLAQPVRVALTGGTASPGIHETLRVVGRERSLARIDAAVAYCEARR